MEATSSQLKQVATPILIGLAGLLSMTLIAFLLNNGSLPTWRISKYNIVNFTFTMQAMVLPISIIAIIIMHRYHKKGFKTFFRAGDRSYIKKNNWNVYGPLLAVGITIANVVFMSMSVTVENGTINQTFFKLLPLILLLAAAN